MKRILVIDDEKDTREVVSIFLELNGYQVMSSSDGEDIMNAINGFSPQMILLDVYLKGTNGVEICNRLKANPVTRNIPVIMLSAETNDYLIMRKCAADDFIAKPFDINLLLDKMSGILSTSTSIARS